MMMNIEENVDAVADANTMQTEDNSYYAGWTSTGTDNDMLHMRSRSDSLDSVLSVLSSISFTHHHDVSANDTMIREEKECCICYEVIDSDKNNCTTPCGHTFCFICIAKSMKVRNTCPCCRQPFYEVSSSIPMVVEDDDNEEGGGGIAVNDWFMEVSTTFTQDEHATEYDEWPLALPHNDSDTIAVNAGYEVLNRNLRSGGGGGGGSLFDEEDQNQNQEPDISSIVFPELMSTLTPPPRRHHPMDVPMDAAPPPHVIGFKRRRFN